MTSRNLGQFFYILLSPSHRHVFTNKHCHKILRFLHSSQMNLVWNVATASTKYAADIGAGQKQINTVFDLLIPSDLSMVTFMKANSKKMFRSARANTFTKTAGLMRPTGNTGSGTVWRGTTASTGPWKRYFMAIYLLVIKRKRLFLRYKVSEP